METSIHEKILVFEPSCTKFGAHILLMFLFTIKEIFSAKVPVLKKFALSSIESTTKRFYLCTEQDWS